MMKLEKPCIHICVYSRQTGETIISICSSQIKSGEERFKKRLELQFKRENSYWFAFECTIHVNSPFIFSQIEYARRYGESIVFSRPLPKDWIVGIIRIGE